MRYPDEFYFSEAQGQEIYTRTPTGNLSVEKLIESKPCWRAPALARIEKPKSLILADWTAAYWSSEKIDGVKKILAELLAQGFSIYIWQNSQVTAMNPELLPTLLGKFDKRITPGQEIIKAAVMQNKLTSDQIQLIDDYWIDHLLSGPGPRILRTSELKNLSPDALALLIQISNAARPK
ncbi:MAG: hypothetical protein EBT92_19085, partial [Planctomycetes bacterium]|nr:hypothetical protein [Planctomycetota bacterium]